MRDIISTAPASFFVIFNTYITVVGTVVVVVVLVVLAAVTVGAFA